MLSLLLALALLAVVCVSAAGCGKTTDVNVQESEEVNTEEEVGKPRMVVK